MDAVVKAVGEPACSDVPSLCNAVGRVVTLAGERQERDEHESKKIHAKRGTVGRTSAVGMKDRDSGVVPAEVADTADEHTLQGFVAVDTEVDAVVCTDEHGSYEDVPRPHQAVEHSVEERVDGRTAPMESSRSGKTPSAGVSGSGRKRRRIAANARLRLRPGIARCLADVEQLPVGIRKYHLEGGGVELLLR